MWRANHLKWKRKWRRRTQEVAGTPWCEVPCSERLAVSDINISSLIHDSFTEITGPAANHAEPALFQSVIIQEMRLLRWYLCKKKKGYVSQDMLHRFMHSLIISFSSLFVVSRPYSDETLGRLHQSLRPELAKSTPVAILAL